MGGGKRLERRLLRLGVWVLDGGMDGVMRGRLGKGVLVSIMVVGLFDDEVCGMIF